MKQYRLEPGARFSVKWGRSVRVVLTIREVTPRKVSYSFQGLDEKYARYRNYFLLEGQQVYTKFKGPFLAWLHERKARVVREQRRKKRTITKRSIKHIVEGEER